MGNKPDLTEQQGAHLREVILRRLLPVMGSQAQLAPLLGIVQSRLSAFLANEYAGTYSLAFRVAFLLDMTIEAVLGIPSLRELSDKQQQRYPTRLFAAKAAFLEGIPLDHIEAMLTTSLKSDGDPGGLVWLRLMRSTDILRPSREDTRRAVARVDAALESGRRAPRKRMKKKNLPPR